MNYKLKNSGKQGTHPIMKSNVKQRKKTNPVKKSTGFLEGLIPSNINLTVNMNDEDKELVLNKIDEMKDDLIFNWRIVQVLMGLGIILGFVGSYLL